MSFCDFLVDPFFSEHHGTVLESGDTIFVITPTLERSLCGIQAGTKVAWAELRFSDNEDDPVGQLTVRLGTGPASWYEDDLDEPREFVQCIVQAKPFKFKVVSDDEEDDEAM